VCEGGFVVRTILAVISTFALQCSAIALSLSPADEAARDVALQWLELLIPAITKTPAPGLGASPRVADWTKYFAAHRAPLGRVNNRRIAEVKHASTVPGDPELRLHAIVRSKLLLSTRLRSEPDWH